MRRHCASTLSIFQHDDLGPIQRGDIFALGRHRLACIDATNKADVARLFAGKQPTLVVTSPPYVDARSYDAQMLNWDALMLGAFEGHAWAQNVQMLVNLGSVNRDNEWQPYWFGWVQAMRQRGWRHAGLYVWDKLNAHPGNHNGRPRPAHEFIVHINRLNVPLNKSVPCKGPGRLPGQYGLKGKDNARRTDREALPCQQYKVLDSVLRMHPEKVSRTGHPAVYPVELPRKLIAAYKATSAAVYDPFSGTASTLLACELEEVDGFAAEVSPVYAQMALERWRKMHPDKPVRRVS